MFVPDQRENARKNQAIVDSREKARSLSPHKTLVAHPATTPDSHCEQLKQEGNITLVSCGLGMFWKGSVLQQAEHIVRGNRNFWTVKEMLDYYRWHHKEIQFGREECAVLFRHFVERHPEYADHHLVILICLNMDDPYHDNNLRDHTGYHPSTMLNFAKKVSEDEVG